MIQKHFIATQIRRTNRNLGILTLLTIIPGIILLAIGGIEGILKLIAAFIEGPFGFELLLEIISNFMELLFFVVGLRLLIYGSKKMWQLVPRLIHFEQHPIYKEVAYYGEFEDVALNIHYDLIQSGHKKYKNIYITEHWVMQITAFHLAVLKLEDVVWAYERVSKQEHAAVIPGVVSVGPSEVARTYSVVIHSRNPLVPMLQASITHELDFTEDIEGNALEGKRKQAYMNTILEELERRHPRAIYGYSRDLEEMWYRDRRTFIKSAGFSVN